MVNLPPWGNVDAIFISRPQRMFGQFELRGTHTGNQQEFPDKEVDHGHSDSGKRQHKQREDPLKLAAARLLMAMIKKTATMLFQNRQAEKMAMNRQPRKIDRQAILQPRTGAVGHIGVVRYEWKLNCLFIF